MRLGLKMLLVLGMSLAILIPLTMIRGVIHDRQMYRAQAVERVARSYAGEQAFVGPVLVVPYTEIIAVEEKDQYGQVKVTRREKAGQWTFFPDTLEIGGHLKPGTREVGLHRVRVYEWQGSASATFAVEIPADGDSERRIGRPQLRYGLGDVRGLGSPRLRVNGRELLLQEGLGGGAGASGVHARLRTPTAGGSLRLETRLDFVLAGTESLALAPLGRSNHFTLDSSWPHPGFAGSFLPRVSEIDESGFKAEWQVSSLATTAQAQYLKGARAAGDGASPLEMVQVRLVDPVNIYSQADRATKYGVLFVLLTFVGFFLFELVKQLRIHPIQYALVGMAVAIFFLLLVSLSEHLAFGWSYLASSVACIGLIAFYLCSVLHSVLRGLGFAAMLATLYAALYGLLVSEDNALVLGAGLLFLILATLMVVTRKVDWYQLASNSR